jgi:predicted site-specific integrase-resolvase
VATPVSEDDFSVFYEDLKEYDFRLLKPSEVAWLMKVNVATVQRRRRAGKLPAVNVGTEARPRYRHTYKDVARFLANE